MSESISPKSRRAERSLSVMCTSFLQLDPTSYAKDGVVALSKVAAAVTCSSTIDGRRPIYSIFNVAVGCGALVKVGEKLYRWSPDIAGLLVNSHWHNISIKARHQMTKGADTSFGLTIQIMNHRWKGSQSVSQISADLGVKQRRVYEVAALLASFGVLRRKGSRARYKRVKHCTLQAPDESPKREVEIPPSSIETRACRKRQKLQEQQRSAAARTLFPQLTATLNPPASELWWGAPFAVTVEQEEEELSALDRVFEAYADSTMIY